MMIAVRRALSERTAASLLAKGPAGMRSETCRHLSSATVVSGRSSPSTDTRLVSSHAGLLPAGAAAAALQADGSNEEDAMLVATSQQRVVHSGAVQLYVTVNGYGVTAQLDRPTRRGESQFASQLIRTPSNILSTPTREECRDPSFGVVSIPSLAPQDDEDVLPQPWRGFHTAPSLHGVYRLAFMQLYRETLAEPRFGPNKDSYITPLEDIWHRIGPLSTIHMSLERDAFTQISAARSRNPSVHVRRHLPRGDASQHDAFAGDGVIRRRYPAYGAMEPVTTPNRRELSFKLSLFDEQYRAIATTLLSGGPSDLRRMDVQGMAGAGAGTVGQELSSRSAAAILASRRRPITQWLDGLATEDLPRTRGPLWGLTEIGALIDLRTPSVKGALSTIGAGQESGSEDPPREQSRMPNPTHVKTMASFGLVQRFCVAAGGPSSSASPDGSRGSTYLAPYVVDDAVALATLKALRRTQEAESPATTTSSSKLVSSESLVLVATQNLVYDVDSRWPFYVALKAESPRWYAEWHTRPWGGGVEPAPPVIGQPLCLRGEPCVFADVEIWQRGWRVGLGRYYFTPSSSIFPSHFDV